jgi:TRAP-type mannitol/chloroaromatic compound transport system substrate-binding protein
MPLEYVGDFNDWKIYKNAEGYYEGWKSGGRKVNILKDTNNNQVSKRTDHNHIVTQAKDMSGFIKVVTDMEERHKPKSSIKPDQPKLFNDDLP